MEVIDEDEDVEASDDDAEHVTPVHNAGKIEAKITEDQAEAKLSPLSEEEKKSYSGNAKNTRKDAKLHKIDMRKASPKKSADAG